MESDESTFKISDELIESIRGLNEMISQQQDQAAAMLYRLMFRHERNINILDHYSDILLDRISGMGGKFAEEDYRNFLQYLSVAVPSEYAPHKKMFDEEIKFRDSDDEDID